jgi:hypothetical protein
MAGMTTTSRLLILIKKFHMEIFLTISDLQKKTHPSFCAYAHNKQGETGCQAGN